MRAFFCPWAGGGREEEVESLGSVAQDQRSKLDFLYFYHSSYLKVCASERVAVDPQAQRRKTREGEKRAFKE